jgi:REP element-mobilizing transposase RayT
MARKLRIEFEGATYHAYSRGNERADIFRCVRDRRLFLDLLAAAARRHSWQCLAYCLMSNHYHLLVRTLKATLSAGMRWLNENYAQRFNRRYGRVGHLFQGRFKDTLVQDGGHEAVASRYIVLNPVRAGLVRLPEEWPWSSYGGTAGLCVPHPCLSVEAALSAFGPDAASARREYASFVSSGIGSGRPAIYVPIFGDSGFVEAQKARLGGRSGDREYPLVQRLPSRPALDELIPASARWRRDGIGRRNLGMLAAVMEYGYTQREVAEFTGLHYTQVSRIVSGQTVEMLNVKM